MHLEEIGRALHLLAHRLSIISSDVSSVTRRDVYTTTQHVAQGFEIGTVVLKLILRKHMADPTDLSVVKG
jgi:hypothetical protein